MSQLDNFRKSLGLPNPDEAKTEVGGRQKADGERRGRTKRTVALREETYLRIRAIILWMMMEKKQLRPSVDDIVNMGLEALAERESGLNSYLNSHFL